MIQNELPQVFCQQHNDYMIEVVCYDYLSQKCRFMCKKCYQQSNISNTQSKDQEFKQRQLEFQKTCSQQKEQLNHYLEQKIQTLSGDFKAVIKSHLENITVQFSNSLQLIDGYVSQLSNVSKEDLKKTIEKQKYEISKLRSESIANKSNQLNEFKNKIIQIALNIENQIFEEHLLGQQLYQIPELQTIFKNFDTNNLLFSFEQNYHLKYQYIIEQDIQQRMGSYQQELSKISLRNIEFQKNLDNKYQEIEGVLQNQKEQMLARFKKYKNWVIENNKQIDENIKKAQNNHEIQMMTQQDFVNLGLVDLANNKLKNYLDEFKETLSKICHLGFYDIKVSLKDIETNFMHHLIPIKLLSGMNPMQSNILRQYPCATQIQANVNNGGNFEGQVQIIEPSAITHIQISKKEEQVGNSIQNYQNQSLFNFNLLKFFPDSKNKFNYQLTRTQSGDETYVYGENQWQLKKQENGKYKFTVCANLKDQITFEDIVIRDNILDENSIIKVKYSDSKNEYEGQINNNFQYSGRGKLIDNGIIKDGIWKNGQLNGIGKVLESGIELYNGNFENGMKQGNGREFLISDLYYDGQFERDEKHGEGKIVKKKGDEFITVEEKIKWKNGQSQNDVCKIF